MSRIRLIMYNIFVLNLSGDINIINFFIYFNLITNVVWIWLDLRHGSSSSPYVDGIRVEVFNQANASYSFHAIFFLLYGFSYCICELFLLLICLQVQADWGKVMLPPLMVQCRSNRAIEVDIISKLTIPHW